MKEGGTALSVRNKLRDNMLLRTENKNHSGGKECGCKERFIQELHDDSFTIVWTLEIITTD